MKKKKIIIIIVVGIAIFIAGCFLIHHLNDKKNKEAEELLVANLAEQIVPYERSFLGMEEDKYGYMFSNIKIDHNNIGNGLKFGMIYRELLRTGYDGVKYYRPQFEEDENLEDDIDWDDINNWEEIEESEYLGPQEDGSIKVYYEITREKVHEMARDMFGQDTLIDGDYTLSPAEGCSFRNDEYFCHNFAGGGTGVDFYMTKFDHYEKEGEDIVIYQKAYWLANSDETEKLIVAASCDSENVTEIDDYSSEFDETLYQKYGRMYKSIFRKNSDGKYYWISSEPVENND